MPKWFLLILFCGLFSGLYAAKNDIVILKNGDRITGEIKELKKGKLKYSTDDIGVIYIEWTNISELYSPVYFEFVTAYGEKYFGSIGWSKPGYFKVIGPMLTKEIEINDVVILYPIKNSFWQRVDGSFNIGLSYTKASDVIQTNTDLKIIYRNRKSTNELKYSNILTYQQSSTQSTKQDASYSYGRLIQKKFYWSTGLSWQQNSQLGILSRTSINGQYGKLLLVSNSNSLHLSAGLVLNSEVSYDDERNENMEAVAQITYDFYSFDDPKLNIYVHYYVYPSLTIAGRVRQDFSSEIKWKFISDFTFSLQLYTNVDSNPVTLGASNLDWGIITSLGYTF